MACEQVARFRLYKRPATFIYPNRSTVPFHFGLLWRIPLYRATKIYHFISKSFFSTPDWHGFTRIHPKFTNQRRFFFCRLVCKELDDLSSGLDGFYAIHLPGEPVYFSQKVTLPPTNQAPGGYLKDQFPLEGTLSGAIAGGRVPTVDGRNPFRIT